MLEHETVYRLCNSAFSADPYSIVNSGGRTTAVWKTLSYIASYGVIFQPNEEQSKSMWGTSGFAVLLQGFVLAFTVSLWTSVVLSI